MIQCLIVEDEIAGQLILVNKLKLLYPECHVLAVIDNKNEALHYLSKHHVDLVFLDAYIKGGTGLEIIETLCEWEKNEQSTATVSVQKIEYAYTMPEVVFITAYKEYAIDALNANASYYLLKPIQETHFQRGLDLVLERIREKQQKQKQVPVNLLITYKQDVMNVAVQSILYFRADGAYTYIHTEKEVLLSSRNLRHYEKILVNAPFVRCHTSYLVNMHHIKRINRHRSGSIIMNNDEILPIAQRRLSEVILKMSVL